MGPGSEDLHLDQRSVVGGGGHAPESLHDAHSAGHAAEDGVLPVEPGGGRQRDEELRAVGVGAGVGHGDDARAGVPQLGGDLVAKLAAEYALPSSTGARRVATLDHEVSNDPAGDNIGGRRKGGVTGGRWCRCSTLRGVTVAPRQRTELSPTYLGELTDVETGPRGVLVVELDGEAARGRLEGHMRVGRLHDRPSRCLSG